MQQLNVFFFQVGKLSGGSEGFDDFRPISLCNLLYKFITKIMVNRLKKVMGGLVQLNQTTFIEGRSIVENILMCHEVIHGFERKNHAKAIFLKIDLLKAYDSMSWDFNQETLQKRISPINSLNGLWNALPLLDSLY